MKEGFSGRTIDTKFIDETIVRVAIEKIYKYNPKRYYILSNVGVKQENQQKINDLIDEVRKKHGCQIIVNGLIPSLKYYLRLITHLEDFTHHYGQFLQTDKELQKVHKEQWNQLTKKYF